MALVAVSAYAMDAADLNGIPGQVYHLYLRIPLCPYHAITALTAKGHVLAAELRASKVALFGAGPV